MRLTILHPDTCLAMFMEEYKRERSIDRPMTEEEIADCWERYNEELERTVPRQIPGMIQEIRSAARATRRSHAQIRVAAEVEQRWGNAFTQLQHLIEAVSELARRSLIRIEHTAAENVGNLHRVRTILMIRAIQTAQGIETLLRSGHSAVAWAQWRILHELAVVTLFVNKHGEETATAYVQHGVEQSYRTLNAYRTHHSGMADNALLSQMLESHVQWKRALESADEYGPGFGATYGWAGAALGKQRPELKDLEADVGMSVARPEYQVASNVVHPGIRGFLDHCDPEGDESTMPWEPGASLLREPLALTAKTLTALTGGLVDVSSAASDYVLLGAITKLRDELLGTLYPTGSPDHSEAPIQA